VKTRKISSLQSKKRKKILCARQKVGPVDALRLLMAYAPALRANVWRHGEKRHSTGHHGLPSRKKLRASFAHSDILEACLKPHRYREGAAAARSKMTRYQGAKLRSQIARIVNAKKATKEK